MNWTYYGIEFTDEHIPDKAIGFIYRMSAVINNTSVAYIGKKNFYANTKKKLGKKAAPKDKRKKDYIRVSKLAYHAYYSSNDILKAAHKKGVQIKREILRICYSKTELTYQEVKHQFAYDVLEDDLYLNGNILGRFYKNKTT
jgi:hypothetical protein